MRLPIDTVAFRSGGDQSREDQQDKRRAQPYTLGHLGLSLHEPAYSLHSAHSPEPMNTGYNVNLRWLPP